MVLTNDRKLLYYIVVKTINLLFRTPEMLAIHPKKYHRYGIMLIKVMNRSIVSTHHLDLAEIFQISA